MTICVEDIITEYESGKTYQQIADTLGIGESTVRKYLTECRDADTLAPSTALRQKNIQLLRQEQEISLSDEFVLDQYRDFTLYQISTRYHVSQESLIKQLERLGVNFHPDFYESVVLAVYKEKSYIYLKDKVLPYGPDLIRNIDYLVDTALTEKERNVVKKLYAEGKTFKDAAKDLGCCDSNIGDLRNRVLYKLRKPKNFMYFTMTYDEIQKLMEPERLKKQAEQDAYDSLLPIKEYVSVRTYHLLLRAGFRDINEIREDMQRIVNFRGAGNRTIVEVMNALQMVKKQEAG